MTGAPLRAVVVLGYSNGRRDGLHPVCAARLAHGARISTAADVVILSGWARAPGARSEARLMAEAWTGRAAEIVVDEDARTTAENAANAVADLRRLGATEVVVVTSSWHARRAEHAFRRLLRPYGVTVTASTPGDRSWRGAFREVWVWPLLWPQLRLARRRAPVG